MPPNHTTWQGNNHGVHGENPPESVTTKRPPVVLLGGEDGEKRGQALGVYVCVSAWGVCLAATGA